jgi:magnesium-transporting ATPase (P-type)
MSLNNNSTNSTKNNKQIKRLVGLLGSISLLGSVICSLSLIGAYKNNNINTLFYLTLFLAIFSILFVIFCFIVTIFYVRDVYEFVGCIVVFGSVFGISCKLLKDLQDIKSKSDQEIVNELENNKTLIKWQLAAGIPIVGFIVITMLCELYENKIENKKNLATE